MHNDVDRFLLFLRFVEKYGEAENGTKKKAGTDREWTPYRFCSEDWVLGALVVRTSRKRYEIGLFLSEDHFEFERDGGLKACLAFALADAYFRTGKMALHFCGASSDGNSPIESGFEPKIPEKLCDFAKDLGISFNKRTVINDGEGRLLYQALVSIGSTLRELIASRCVDPVHAAFLVHRGVFSPLSLEILMRYSARPAALLQGVLPPEEWLVFKQELLVMRTALMAERAAIACADQLQLRILGLGEAPLALNAEQQEHGVGGNGPQCKVILMPFGEDEFPQIRGCSVPQGTGAVVVPKNYVWTPEDLREGLRSLCEKRQAHLFSIRDTVEELDSEVLQRLEKCASTRTGVEEQSE